MGIGLGRPNDLHHAIQNEDHAAVEHILQNDNSLVDCSFEGVSLLHRALLEQKNDIALLLMSYGADLHSENGKDGLIHTVCRLGNHVILEQMLKKDVDINVRDSRGHTPLTLSLEEGLTEIARKLLEHEKTDVNMPALLLLDKTHRPKPIAPLTLAIKNGNDLLVRLLCDRGACLDNQDYNGYNALHHAAITGNTDIIGYLLQNYVNVDVPDRNVYNPLHLACYHGHVDAATMLVQAGADINAWKSEKDLQRMLSPVLIATEMCHTDLSIFLIKNGADVHTADDAGNTLLIKSVQNGLFPVTKYLVSKGVDVTVKNKNGDFALLFALQFGRRSVQQRLQKAMSNTLQPSGVYQQCSELPDICRTFTMLIAAGANINEKDSQGLTVMDYSVRFAILPVIVILLKHGAQPSRGIRLDAPQTSDILDVLCILRSMVRTDLFNQILQKTSSEIQEIFVRNVKPTSLKSTARFVIRDEVQKHGDRLTSIIPALETLPLPKSLIAYLCYESESTEEINVHI
ncbi:hypothetical protein ACJMK2_032323 [Sinanodonta woodiana]|uniref:SOCS box domain-containing protein n=1 Tax=Sinanodonta woodiana TaxID=1069815 RepID=A0ABD3X1D5_SINWO